VVTSTRKKRGHDLGERRAEEKASHRDAGNLSAGRNPEEKRLIGK